jgi:dihydroflavonol-4-reductase
VDVRNRVALERAVRGCNAVVHVAALYSFTASALEIEAVNVGGSRNVIAACRAAGVRRLLHSSTAGTCGPVWGRVATEGDGPPCWDLGVPYKRTKLEAEELVLAAALDGLEALCVNPTTPIGDGDDAPTPTGRMVRGVACGRCRATLRSGGLNLVDVRDVARGHVLALERGRVGERYILGGADLSLAEVFALIARAAGRRPPLIRLPYAAAQALALVGPANAHEVALARLPASPIEPAVERAVRAALRPVQARPQTARKGPINRPDSS